MTLECKLKYLPCDLIYNFIYLNSNKRDETLKSRFCFLGFCLLLSDSQESASEGLLSSAGRGVEKGSLQKHSSSSRKLGRQEGDGALGPVSGSLGLAPGKSKLKDKLSAIRQDRAERRESLQKQDAIHEVDSSEDETDEGSEDSQDGRRGATFTPPPLLRPTTVRTGPGGTLPSLCLSPCTPHATFTHTGPSQVGRPTSTAPAGLKDGGQERKVPEPSGSSKPPQGPLPFSTPGSAFISVSKDTFLKPYPPQDPKAPNGKTDERSQDSLRTTAPPAGGASSSPDSRTATSTTDGREPPRASCSSPGIPKDKKEADNRRLCAAAAAGQSAPPAPPTESGMDKVVSQLATAAKSVLGPVKLGPSEDKSTKDQKPCRGGAPEPSDPPTPNTRRDSAAPPSCQGVPERPASGAAAAQHAISTNPPFSAAASEPQHRRPEPPTPPASAAANATSASSQQSKATSRKT